MATSYELIGEPPLLSGAFQLICSELGLGLLSSLGGAHSPGRTAGVTNEATSEYYVYEMFRIIFRHGILLETILDLRLKLKSNSIYLKLNCTLD